jgi:hypothetical protein
VTNAEELSAWVWKQECERLQVRVRQLDAKLSHALDALEAIEDADRHVRLPWLVSEALRLWKLASRGGETPQGTE